MTKAMSYHQQTKDGIGKKRDTNLELFRIITMLLIIAHHYVVNSGLMPLLKASPLSTNSIFLLIFGAWGKTGINCFVLITGFFMCKSTMTAKRFARIFLEVMFYRLIFTCIFWFCGYEAFSLRTVAQLIPIRKISNGFTSAYMVFMLCIPFINILIHNTSQRQHFYLLMLMSFVYIFLGTFRIGFSVTMNYVSWFMVLYLFASYVRLYPAPNGFFENTKLWGWMTLSSILISTASVLVCARFGNSPYFFVTDSNTLLAFITGFSAFMFFKNIRIPYNRFINLLASTCFGVLLIHANSDTMRQWLWKDVLNNTGVFSKPWMPIHAIGSILLIFLICAGIDYIRICCIEKPFFKVWDRHYPRFANLYKKTENKIFLKLGILK